MESPQHIPIVDLNGDAEFVASELVRAFEDVGFCYLKNYGISTELIETCMAESKMFFSQNEDEKLRHALRYGIDESFFGYCPNKQHGDIKVDRYDEKFIEHRESFTAIEYMDESKWPVISSAPFYRRNLCNLLSASHEFLRQLATLLGKGLGLSDPEKLVTALQKLGNRGNSTSLRINYYPAVDDIGDTSKRTRFGEHTDYGFITVVFQRPGDCGLEVCMKSGEFISAPAKPGCVIVNIGDCLQRLTSDRLRSTIHRVSLKPDENGGKTSRERISLIISGVFDDDFEMESEKYPTVKSKDYINGRYKKSFEKPEGIPEELKH